MHIPQRLHHAQVWFFSGAESITELDPFWEPNHFANPFGLVFPIYLCFARHLRMERGVSFCELSSEQFTL